MESSDPQSAFKIQRILMTFTGIWPKKRPSHAYTAKEISGSVIFPFTLFSLLTYQLYLVRDDVSQASYSSCMSVTMLAYFLKLLILHIRKPHFLKIVNDLQKPILVHPSQHHMHEIVKANKISKMITKIYQGCMFSAAISLFVVALFNNDDRNLPVPFPFRMKNHALWAYACIYVFQFFAIMLFASNITCIDTVVCSFMILASAHLKILQKNITHATDDDGTGKRESRNDVYNKRLTQSVRYYDAIISYVKSIEATFSYGFFIQLLASLFATCCIGFSISVISPTSPQFIFLVCYFSSMMNQLAIYCACGNEIIIQSSMVRDACYMTKWRSCNSTVRKTLFMLMERSKRPLSVTAGKFFPLSFQTFAKIINASCSYFALLRTLYTKQTQ